MTHSAFELGAVCIRKTYLCVAWIGNRMPRPVSAPDCLPQVAEQPHNFRGEEASWEGRIASEAAFSVEHNTWASGSMLLDQLHKASGRTPLHAAAGWAAAGRRASATA